MLAQSFTVVSHDHDQRPPIQAAGVQEIDEPLELPVGIGDSGIVRPILELLAKDLRARLVRRMGIKQMDPAKEGLGGSALQPSQRAIHARLAVSPPMEIVVRITAPAEIVIISVESAVQPELSIEDVTADE